MKVYVYEHGCTGKIFFSDEILDFEHKYCETCGSCDILLGEVTSKYEFLYMMIESRYTAEYIREMLTVLEVYLEG